MHLLMISIMFEIKLLNHHFKTELYICRMIFKNARYEYDDDDDFHC